MKIAICGKGGSGKSTLTTMVARGLLAKGKKVLVIDTDESNFGLCGILGLSAPKDFSMILGGREEMWKSMKGDFGRRFIDDTWTIDKIPEEYRSKDGNLTFITGGKINDAGEGCACLYSKEMKEFMENLLLNGDEYAIVDTEAGVEHFGRGMDANVDVVFMVVDPSNESVKLSRKIGSMCRSLKKPMYIVLNKSTPSTEKVLREQLSDGNVIASIRMDDIIMESGLLGSKLSVPDSVTEPILRVLGVS